MLQKKDDETVTWPPIIIPINFFNIIEAERPQIEAPTNHL